MTVNIYQEIERLLQYGLKKGLVEVSDLIYTRNRLLQVLGLDEFSQMQVEDENLVSPTPILDQMLDWAVTTGRLESDSSVYRDLLDTELMNCLMPRPSEIIQTFDRFYQDDPKLATDYYYQLSRNSNYIRTDRVAKNMVWKTETEYGEIDITINLSKPEKDPKAIAAQKQMPTGSYPKCLLCKENEGYAGRLNHPARQNHRIIPIRLGAEDWFLQYSPYVYYNEHCIVFKKEHEPMQISEKTFARLLAFVEIFPHYFLGSNADLPIVGGSILTHDHFQGGNHSFAMAKAPLEETITLKGFERVQVGIVKWPMSVLRLRGKRPDELAHLGGVILQAWRNYSDEELEIFSHTEGVPHNTITPVARKNGEYFELDLVLRNNRTNDQYPDGIYHPHRDLHHIKRENIGVIEVMGLAVLPARLRTELAQIAHYLLNPDQEAELQQNPELEKHHAWYNELKEMNHDFSTVEEVQQFLQEEVGKKFALGLEHAGVFKRDEAGKAGFLRFLDSMNLDD